MVHSHSLPGLINLSDSAFERPYDSSCAMDKAGNQNLLSLYSAEGLYEVTYLKELVPYALNRP